MDQRERQIIDDLFGKLRAVDAQTPRRDPDAEQAIAQHLSTLPAAPYYMAQAIHVQEQALAAAQGRVQELERQLAQAPAGGGFLSSLFGGGTQPAVPQRPQQPSNYQNMGMARGPWGGSQGGGFLAGAMQTAMGVAGGMLVADAISSAFSSGTAEAAEVPPDSAESTSWDDSQPADHGQHVEDDFDADMGFEDNI